MIVAFTSQMVHKKIVVCVCMLGEKRKGREGEGRSAMVKAEWQDVNNW